MISLRLFAAGALLAASSVVLAAPKPAPACSFGDLSGVTVTGCAGFVSGNLVSGNADSQALAADLLGDLGLAGATGTWIEKVEGFLGDKIVFDTPLYGLTYIGLHRGGAGDGGQGTAFYVFDAGQNGTVELLFNRGGLSNAAVYSTGTTPAVPEPAAAALLLAGLAGLRLAARRRA
jgi:hypothetical protein